MATIINKQELPGSATSRQFEGYLYENVPISFFISETPPGKGPSLHKHPYSEVFVVLDGQLTFTVGDTPLEATGGQVVIAPANSPHKFINSGQGPARHIDMHAARQMVTTWLES